MTLRRWLRPLEWAAALVVAVFLGLYIARHWEQIPAYPWSIDLLSLGLASACVAVAYTGFVLLWRHILILLGGGLSIVDAHRTWYLGNLARYVPGKVWQLASTAYLARAKGVSPVLTITASITGQLFLLAAGLFLSGLALPGINASVPANVRLLGVAGAIALFIVLFTPAFDILYRAGLRLIGRSEYYTYIRWSERLVLLVGNLVAWLAFGTGFYLFLVATAEIPEGGYLPILGISAAGYLIGWLVVFVPGGLGVREGVYALLLSLYLPGAVAAAVAVLSRLWLSAVELIVVALLLARYGLKDLRWGPDSSGTAATG